MRGRQLIGSLGVRLFFEIQSMPKTHPGDLILAHSAGWPGLDEQRWALTAQWRHGSPRQHPRGTAVPAPWVRRRQQVTLLSPVPDDISIYCRYFRVFLVVYFGGSQRCYPLVVNIIASNTSTKKNSRHLCLRFTIVSPFEEKTFAFPPAISFPKAFHPQDDAPSIRLSQKCGAWGCISSVTAPWGAPILVCCPPGDRSCPKKP